MKRRHFKSTFWVTNVAFVQPKGTPVIRDALFMPFHLSLKLNKFNPLTQLTHPCEPLTVKVHYYQSLGVIIALSELNLRHLLPNSQPQTE